MTNLYDVRIKDIERYLETYTFNIYLILIYHHCLFNSYTKSMVATSIFNAWSLLKKPVSYLFTKLKKDFLFFSETYFINISNGMLT